MECPCGAQFLHDDQRGICSHPSCTEVGCEDCFEKCEGCGKRFCEKHLTTVDGFPFCFDCIGENHEPTRFDWFATAVDICGRES